MSLFCRISVDPALVDKMATNSLEPPWCRWCRVAASTAVDKRGLPEEGYQCRRHADDAQSDVRYCEVHDVQVPRGVHLRPSCHHETH